MNIGFVIAVAGVTFVCGMAVDAVFLSKKDIQPVSAYGLYEKDQVWNRIRVDEKGNVICHKE